MQGAYKLTLTTQTHFRNSFDFVPSALAFQAIREGETLKEGTMHANRLALLAYAN